MILTESVPKIDPKLGEVIPKSERLSTDIVVLSTEKEPFVKGEVRKKTLIFGFPEVREGVISP